MKPFVELTLKGGKDDILAGILAYARRPAPSPHRAEQAQMTNRLYSSLDEYRGSGYGAAIARQLVRQILLRASVTLPARFDGLSAGENF